MFARIALACAANLLFLATPMVWADLPFQKNQRVLFLGDSITQDGRYVDLVQAYLWHRYPDLGLTVVNAGLSSETVSGITEPVHPYPRPNIHDRVESALALADPDWVIVCYGMNDGIYHPVEQRITDAYRDGLTKLVEKLNATGAKVILVTPPAFEIDIPATRKRLAEAKPDEPYGYRKPYEKYDETLHALSAIAMSLKPTPGVHSVIDLHTKMDQYVVAAKQAQPGYVYGDGVHPPLDGHCMMAIALLEGLGENANEAQTKIAWLTNVRPVTASADKFPAASGADAVWKAVNQRGRDLSAAYRKAVKDQRRRVEDDPALADAIKVAADRADVARKLIVELK